MFLDGGVLVFRARTLPVASLPDLTVQKIASQ